MDVIVEKITQINGALNNFIWGVPGLVLLIGTGLLLTVCTKVFQVSHLKHWWQETIGSLFRKDSTSTKKTDKKSKSDTAQINESDKDKNESDNREN